MKARAPRNDISSAFHWNPTDAIIARNLLKYEATPQAIIHFAEQCDKLTDYAYWFMLSTLWVSYTGFSELELWKQLLSSQRPGRERSLMKPSEYNEYRRSLRSVVTAYRAHRPGESDWIAYTRRLETAQRFARERGASQIAVYEIPRSEIIALFLRRGEDEIIVLDRDKARFTGYIEIKEEAP